MAGLCDVDVSRILVALKDVDLYVEHQREFIVHGMSDVDRPLVKHALKIPFSGQASLESDKLNNCMVGDYTTTSGSTVIIDGWADFCFCHGIRRGSVLMIEVDTIGGLHLYMDIINR